MRESFRSGCCHTRNRPVASPHNSKPSGDQVSTVEALPVACPRTVDRLPDSDQTITSPVTEAAASESPLSEIASFVRTSASDLRTRVGSTGVSLPRELSNVTSNPAANTARTAAATITLVFPCLNTEWSLITSSAKKALPKQTRPGRTEHRTGQALSLPIRVLRADAGPPTPPVHPSKPGIAPVRCAARRVHRRIATSYERVQIQVPVLQQRPSVVVRQSTYANDDVILNSNHRPIPIPNKPKSLCHVVLSGSFEDRI